MIWNESLLQGFVDSIQGSSLLLQSIIVSKVFRCVEETVRKAWFVPDSQPALNKILVWKRMINLQKWTTRLKTLIR